MNFFNQLIKLSVGCGLIISSTSAFSSPLTTQKALEYQAQKESGEKIADQTTNRLSPPTSPSTRIVGGDPATPGDWPYMTALIFKGATPDTGQFCGGSLIRPDIVLTAAHCVFGATPNNFDVYIGSQSLSDPGAEGEIITVDKIRVHEQYDPALLSNDIALVYLSQPSTQDVVLTIPAELMDSIDLGTTFTVAGWGNMEPNGFQQPDLLQQVDVNYISNEECQAAYDDLFGPGVVTETMLCAGTPEGGKDSCHGDSGGPLVVNIKDQDYQVGVVSWGNPTCAQTGFYGVYSRVAHFETWLEKTIEGTIALNPVADPSLQMCIDSHAEQFGWTKVNEVTELICNGMGVESLEGLEVYENIELLAVADNPIADLSPIKALTSITLLDLSFTLVSELSDLAHLQNLEVLFLFGANEVTCVDPNIGVFSYEDLAGNCFNLISDTFIPDFGLQQCVTNEASINNWVTIEEVNTLFCDFWGIESLEGIEAFENLSLFFAQNNAISDVTPLAGLTDLTMLILSFNQISNIDALANLTNLGFLALWSNQIIDISALASMTNLTFLDLEDNLITDISPLEDLVLLDTIFLGNNDGITCMDVPLSPITHADIPDACFIQEIDSDGDGVLDHEDNCPNKRNPGQKDTDQDGQGNRCDLDDDNDGFTDAEENRVGSDPRNPNSTPETILFDWDSDGILDEVDNCPVTPNANQKDFDLDGMGDRCDTDDDNDGFSDALENNVGSKPKDPNSTPITIIDDADSDGVPDSWDNCLGKANPNQKDTDQDGMGNACDPDDDNDGFTDKEEKAAGTNPRNPNSFPGS